MRTTGIVLALHALGAAAQDGDYDEREYVESESLQELINIDDLLKGSQALQDFADENDGHRAFGSGGHNATVDYVVETLEATDYYDVVKQPFTELFAQADGSITIGGEDVPTTPLTYTPGGSAEGAALVKVAELGCVSDDYPAELEGAVAFTSRGECTFGEKATLAKAAGAVGVIIYNNEEGELSGTLGEPFGEYAPSLGISLEDSEPILAALEEGEVTVDFVVDAVIEERVSYNVIAETKEGDHDNVLVLGGHSDSVPAGPGINDDGSGIIGILNVAVALANFKVKNAVRFAWWSAEEFGLLGSYHYMKSLNTSEAELTKLRAYLNFDMIASPNYQLGIYDGDGDAFNITGPPGSDVIEADFEDYYDSVGSPHVPSEFSGRSDYAAFIENGIPSGGLFTGAEVLKTEEEVELFGGEAGVAYDPNYHKVGDTIDNLAHDAYLLNTKSIANSVAKYALSFETLPEVELEKRGWTASNSRKVKRGVHAHGHSHSGPCGGNAER